MQTSVFRNTSEEDERLAERRRLRNDLFIARQIQRSLLGPLPRSVALRAGDFPVEARVASAYHPAQEVGGDFYHLTQLADHRLLATIGDASGAGISAALLMVRTLTELHALTSADRAPVDLLGETNRRISRSNYAASFVTALCADIDVTSRVIRIASAGHVPALVRSADGALVRPASRSGTPLGLVSTERYTHDVHRFALGDILVMMTDGIWEALDRPPATGHLDGVISAAGHSPTEIVNALVEEVWRSAAGPDDRTVVAVQIG